MKKRAPCSCRWWRKAGALKKLRNWSPPNIFRLFKKKGFDTVILGCTHYPLIKKVIRRVLGEVNIVDSAEVTAAEARANLAARGLLNPRGAGRAAFIASDAPEKFRSLAFRLLRIRTGRVEVKRF